MAATLLVAALGAIIGIIIGTTLVGQFTTPEFHEYVTITLCSAAGATSGFLFGGIAPILGGIIGGVIAVTFVFLGIPPGSGVEELLVYLIVPFILAPIMLAVWGWS